MFALVLKSPDGEWSVRYTYIHTQNKKLWQHCCEQGFKCSQTVYPSSIRHNIFPPVSTNIQLIEHSLITTVQVLHKRKQLWVKMDENISQINKFWITKDFFCLSSTGINALYLNLTGRQATFVWTNGGFVPLCTSLWGENVEENEGEWINVAGNRLPLISYVAQKTIY